MDFMYRYTTESCTLTIICTANNKEEARDSIVKEIGNKTIKEILKEGDLTHFRD